MQKLMKYVALQGTLKKTMVKTLVLWYFLSNCWPFVIISLPWLTNCSCLLVWFQDKSTLVEKGVSRKPRQACITSQNQCMSQNIQVLTVFMYFCEKPQLFVWKTAVFSLSLKWYPCQADNTLPEGWERINSLSQSMFNMLPRIPLGSVCDGGEWFRVTGSCQVCLMAVCQRLALRGGLVAFL